MSGNVFVDTNVLVYSRDASETLKQGQAMGWMKYLWSTKIGRLSFQVLQEFYVTVTKKLQPGLDIQSARNDVRALFAWNPIQVNERVVEGAWLIQDYYKFSWWDSLIISAAQVGECRYILSGDLQANQKLGNIQVISPFADAPESLPLSD